MKFLLVVAAVVLVYLAWIVVSAIRKARAILMKPPLEIHLVPRGGEGRWADAEKVEGHSTAFRARGFVPVGEYAVPEMPGLLLAGFGHVDERLWGVIYEHPVAGVWCDAVARFEGGGSRTVTSAKQGGELDARPGHEKMYLHDATPHALVQGVVYDPRPRAEVDPAGFVAMFERAYADDMIWRASRGGPTVEEIRRAGGGRYPQEVLDATRAQLHAQARDQLAAQLWERYTATLPAEERAWLATFTVVVVHDGWEMADVDLTFGPGSTGDSPRQAFAARAAGWTRLGGMEEPVGADFWAREGPPPEGTTRVHG